jgi:hypothetical protein
LDCLSFVNLFTLWAGWRWAGQLLWAGQWWWAGPSLFPPLLGQPGYRLRDLFNFNNDAKLACMQLMQYQEKTLKSYISGDTVQYGVKYIN